MQLQDKRILLISPQPWEGLQMSKHHLARALVAKGNTVVFLGPPEEGLRGIRIQRDGRFMVATYHHWLKGVNRLPKTIHLWYYRKLIGSIAKATGGPFDVLWCFDTSRLQWFPQGMGYPLLHLADIDILHQGHGLMRGARLVLTVSEPIRQRVLLIAPNARVYDVGHALDEAWFSGESQHKKESVPRTVAYSGQMQWNYVDWTSILAVVQRHEGLEFDFYGPYRDDHPDPSFRLVRSMPNTRFHGVLPKELLMPALHETDILLMCYRSDLPKDQVSNSHKLLEYLATGNVIVASHVPVYQGREDLMLMPGSPGEFGATFDRAVNDFTEQTAPVKREARKAFARRHTLPQLLEQVEQWTAE